MSNRVWFERNEQGEALEAEGRFDEARALYEENVREGCTTTFTFERLAVLYAREGRGKDEAEMLARAVALEESRGVSARLVRLKEKKQNAELRQSRGGVERRAVDRPSERPEPPRLERAAAKNGCLGALAFVASTALAFTILATAMLGS